ncbi:MAG: DNRLRE domain-containing protein [Acidobacteriia bacterium]|nr:DNRLRE domain-containing protein [Terriglobia bacterium]
MAEAARRVFGPICALAILPAAAWAQSTPLVGDAFFNPGVANNFGATVNLNVGGTTQSQSLVQFDLTKLPPGTISSSVLVATLRLFVNKVSTAGALNLYAANAAWSESTVNGVAGLGPGALVAGPINVSVAGTYVVIPVTSQVQAWLNGTPNNGFLIQATSPGTSLFFDSKESTATSHPAALEVVLVPQGGTPGAAGPAGAVGATGPTGAVGPTGAQGDPGASGLAGAAGAPGLIGPSGPAGPPGVTGAKGATGLAGAAGPSGAAGPAGPQGAAGATGPTGPVGSAGPAGAAGPRGVTGAAGATGPTGPAGAAGLIQNNFTISPLQPATGSISGTLTQNVIRVSNPAAIATYALPSAGPGTTGKELLIVLDDFSANSNSINLTAAAGDQIVIGSAIVCTTGAPCTNTSFPVNFWVHVVSDGNHHWFVPVND